MSKLISPPSSYFPTESQSSSRGSFREAGQQIVVDGYFICAAVMSRPNFRECGNTVIWEIWYHQGALNSSVRKGSGSTL